LQNASKSLVKDLRLSSQGGEYVAAPLKAWPTADVESLAATVESDYDLVIVDLFYHDADGVAMALSQADLDTIRHKA